MLLVIFFPFVAGFCMMLHLAPLIHQILLFAGYAVAIGTIARYSWIAAAAEVRLVNWRTATREHCPPHLYQIIRHSALEEEDDDGGL